MTFSRLPISLLALTIAGPVLAAEPAAMAPSQTPATAAPAHPAAAPQSTLAAKGATVDINSASTADLKTLPGMTDADAAKIVQGRPYKDPADLVSKKILSDSEYAKIKD